MPLDVADDEAAQRPEAQPPVADVLECGLDQLASDSLPLEAGRNDGVRQDAAARLLFVFEDRHIAVEFQFVAVSGRVVRDRVWVLFHVAAVFCRNPSKYGSEIVFLRAMMDRIADILLDWYAREGRDLPWRRTRDPYRIWLSEVILQQTRVAQGMDYYLRFTERFPDVRALAAASEDEVLKLWQGLGYYSRARNLHAAAREVVARFGGRFPSDYESVRSLRGVGDYTAAAVCSAAFDAPCAVVDGNVYRVLSRLFDVAEPIDTAAGRKAFAELAQTQLDRRALGRYNQAIMDFGALQCTPSSPRCGACPLSEGCLALAAGTVADRPVKQGRTQLRDRWFNYLHVTSGDWTLLCRREGRDIWQGLYEFPLIETPAAVDFTCLTSEPRFAELLGDAPWRLLGSVVLPLHRLSHRTIHAVVHRIETPLLTPAARGMAVASDSLGEYAVPRLIDRYLIKYQR